VPERKPGAAAVQAPPVFLRKTGRKGGLELKNARKHGIVWNIVFYN
jgi:hypothetical protein